MWDVVQRVPLELRRRGVAESLPALAPPTLRRRDARHLFLRLSILAFQFVTYDVLKKFKIYFLACAANMRARLAAAWACRSASPPAAAPAGLAAAAPASSASATSA